jgi:hypothetical protein
MGLGCLPSTSNTSITDPLSSFQGNNSYSRFAVSAGNNYAPLVLSNSNCGRWGFDGIV